MRHGEEMRQGEEMRSEEHTSESSHSSISYAVFCLKKKITRYSVHIYLFFFKVSGDPRDLPSFPTRRSSDLTRLRQQAPRSKASRSSNIGHCVILPASASCLP